MINFNYKGVCVYAVVDTVQHNYTDERNRAKTRFERQIDVRVDFWDYNILNDLTDLVFIKAITQYYMQCYWKRSAKDGAKIELEKVLYQQDFRGDFTLKFAARQQKNKYSLHICIEDGGSKKGEVYLEVQEVIMLDIALAKAINLLQPVENHNARLF